MINELLVLLGLAMITLSIYGIIPKRVANFSPKVSVVIAAWNEEKFIEECVKSILKQKYENEFEIIIIGGGKDKTSRICGRLAADNSKIKYFEEKVATGKWVSLNNGISKVRNDYVIILDADCTVPKNWLSTTIQYLSEYDLCDGPQISRETSSFSNALFILEYLSFIIAGGFSKLGIDPINDGANMAFKKEVWEKNKFKNVLLEDVFFAMEAKSSGFRKLFIPFPLVYARRPANFKQFFDQMSRFTRGTFEIASKKPLHALQLSMFAIVPFSMLLTIINALLGNYVPIIILSVTYFILCSIIAANSGLPGRVVQGGLLALSIIPIFAFLIPIYFLEMFTDKRKEWTRINM